MVQQIDVVEQQLPNKSVGKCTGYKLNPPILIPNSICRCHTAGKFVGENFDKLLVIMATYFNLADLWPCIILRST